MGAVRFYPGSLMPPAGFSFFQALEEKAEEGLHLVAFAEGALDALKDAPRLGHAKRTLRPKA